MPRSAPCSTTAALSSPRWVEPQPSLMLRPSGSAPMVTTWAAGAGEGLGRDVGGGAVGLVEDDLQTVETVREDSHEVGDVGLEALVVVTDPADTGTGRTLPGSTGAVLLVHGLDLVLEVVGELVAAAREELDAVVGHGVVAGGEHHAEVGAEDAGEVGHGRGGQHADAQHVDMRRWRAPPRRRLRGTLRTRGGHARPPRSADGPRRCPPRRARAPPRPTGRARAPPSGPRWPHRVRRPCRRVVPQLSSEKYVPKLMKEERGYEKTYAPTARAVPPGRTKADRAGD